MRFVSLFSGIGGIDLGLERAGMTCAAQSEIDPYASAVLRKHWPHVPNLGDITRIDWKGIDLGSIDLIVGGFPCQPVSVAGRQKGEADARWLWPEFARAVRELRPRWILAENVPGLLTSSSGREAQAVFGSLSELGYDSEWACIPAASAGAPHLRYRVCIVAYPDSEGLEGAEPEKRFVVPTWSGRTVDVAYPDQIGRGGWPRIFGSGWRGEPTNGRGWPVEPDVGRVAHGIPARVDRLRALGNAVVPQWAEAVGRLILAADEQPKAMAA